MFVFVFYEPTAFREMSIYCVSHFNFTYYHANINCLTAKLVPQIMNLCQKH